MRTANTLLFLFAFFAMASTNVSFAQQDTSAAQTLHKITLRDGSEVVGTIESETADALRFTTASNVLMVIPQNQVKSKERLSGSFVEGEYRRVDPNNTRLLFAPTARSLKAGQGYFSVAQIFFPFLAVGVTDFASLAGGISLLPGASNQLIYLAPKVTPLHLKNFDLAGGLLYINTTGGNGDGVGIVYGVGTYGSSDAALTAGLGWGFAQGELSNEPVVLIGGELRVSNSVKFITENWIPPSSDIVVVSFGIRFYRRKLSCRLGLHSPGRFRY